MGDGYSLLSIAIMGNIVWMVRHILDCIKKQINTKKRKEIYNMFNTREHGNGFSCIHEACGIGADQCLSLLIEFGINKDLILFDRPDLNGRTPLMIACLNGHQKCCELLLNNKDIVDVTKCDSEGNNVLIYGIESGKVSIIKALSSHPIHSKKYDKKTVNIAKQAANQRGYKQMLQILNTIQCHDDDDDDHNDEYDEYE